MNVATIPLRASRKKTVYPAFFTDRTQDVGGAGVAASDVEDTNTVCFGDPKAERQRAQNISDAQSGEHTSSLYGKMHPLVDTNCIGVLQAIFEMFTQNETSAVTASNRFAVRACTAAGETTVSAVWKFPPYRASNFEVLMSENSVRCA